mgnify:CR=1 FL=1
MAAEATIQAADELPFFPQQFLAELGFADAQIGALPVIGRKPRVAVEFFGESVLLARLQAISRIERRFVFADCELADFVEKCVEIRGRCGERAMERRDRREGRQDERIRSIVARPGENRFDVERHGNQDHAVQRQVLPRVEVVDNAARTGRAVAFAKQKFGGTPAAVFGDELADEVRDRLDVRVDAPEILVFLLAERSRKPRADRVDHHEVGLVEHAPGVVDEVKRWCGGSRFDGDHSARPERTQMEPQRRRSWSAVEGERDRPSTRVLDTFFEIGEVADSGRRLVTFVANYQSSRGRRVGDCFAVDRDGAFGDRALRFGGLGRRGARHFGRERDERKHRNTEESREHGDPAAHETSSFGGSGLLSGGYSVAGRG